MRIGRPHAQWAPIGRARENVCAHGRYWAGSTSGKSFRAGLGSPKDGATVIRAGWAAHLLMGFVYDSTLPQNLKESRGVFMGFVVFETLNILWNLGAASVSFVYWCAAVFQNIIWLESLIQ